jgi:hypothetical protein
MSRRVLYSQCRLARPTPGGEYAVVSWIPTEFAVAGKSIRLRTGKVWESGWIVRSVGATRPLDQVPDFHELSKAHLRATGDSDPR